MESSTWVDNMSSLLIFKKVSSGKGITLLGKEMHLFGKIVHIRNPYVQAWHYSMT